MPFPFSCRPSLLSAILFESSSLIAFPRSSYGIGIALLPLFYLMTTGLRREPPSAAVGALRGIALSRSGVMCRYSVRRAQARRKRLGIRRLELSSQVAGGGGKVISSEKYPKNTESESRKRDSDLSESKNSAEKRVSELSLSYSSSSETDVVFPRIEAMKSWRSITCLPHGSVSVIGRRSEMEDAVRVEPGFLASHSRVYDFFGVYDGHGGSRVAQACRDRLHRLLKEEIEEIGTFESTSLVDWEKVMVACFEKMDEEVNDNRKDSTALSETIGSTAVVAVVGAEVVVVANCGDSRAVLSREGVAVSMSNDHKPDRPDELERIEGAGGRVINWNGHRVLGVLATSRSIGDHYLKPFVIPKPDVAVSKRTNRDEFLILASDGLWDVVSNEVACHVVRQCLYGKMKRSSLVIANGSKLSKFVKDSRAADAAAILAEMAMARGSEDNISVVVVNLNE